MKGYGQDKTTATNKSVALNASTFTQILAANPERLYVTIGNPTAADVFIALTPVATGTDETGLYLPAMSAWETVPGNIYTGEICGIAASSTPTVTVLEY